MSISNGFKSLCPLHRHILNRQMIPWLVFILVNFLLLHSLCRVTPTYFTSLIGGLPMLQMIAQAFCQTNITWLPSFIEGVGELLYIYELCLCFILICVIFCMKKVQVVVFLAMSIILSLSRREWRLHLCQRFPLGELCPLETVSCDQILDFMHCLKKRIFSRLGGYLRVRFQSMTLWYCALN